MTKTPILLDGNPTSLIEMLGDDFEIVSWTDQPDPAELARCVAVLSYSHPTCDGPLMDAMPNLKVISNYGVGVDHIDLQAARKRGIPVGNTPGCLDASTADMTMALILAVARNVVIGDKYAHSSAYTHHDPSILIGHEVTGSTLGIIGMGRIGKQVAKRANGFDMRILYHNRNRDEEAERELNVSYASLDDLLRESDFVALNCPLTEETTGLIGDRELELMKPSAILVNLARGPVVKTDALYRALTSGTIAAAGLDVTDPEPLPRDHPLLELENAIVLPHLGSASDRTRNRMAEMSVENLRAGLAGRELPYRVG
ncbi:MAG: D-glycerate dehydrogenase [Planctomycetaceae bacterium]